MSVIFDIFFRGNATSFEAASKRVLSIGDQVGKKLDSSLGAKIAGIFSAGAVASYAKGVIDFADQITDLSNQLGISTDTLQEWGYAAQKNGSKLETVTKYFEALARAREKALSGDLGSQSSFFNLGVSDSTLKSGSLSQIAAQIASKVKGSNPQDISASLQDVGGKGATELIPAMKAGLDEMAEAARNAGQVLDADVLERLKALKNETQSWFDLFKVGAANIMNVLAPALFNVSDIIKMMFGSVGQFFGTLAGGGSFSEAKQAAFDKMDEVLKDREAREKNIAAAAEADRKKEDAHKDNKPLRVIDIAEIEGHIGKRKMEESQVNSWQRLGAAVRFANESRQLVFLQKIERNTAEIAVSVKPGRKALQNGNFGGAFGP